MIYEEEGMNRKQRRDLMRDRAVSIRVAVRPLFSDTGAVEAVTNTLRLFEESELQVKRSVSDVLNMIYFAVVVEKDPAFTVAQRGVVETFINNAFKELDLADRNQFIKDEINRDVEDWRRRLRHA